MRWQKEVGKRSPNSDVSRKKGRGGAIEASEGSKAEVREKHRNMQAADWYSRINPDRERKEQKEMERDESQQQKQKEYEKYVKQVTPTHNLWLQMVKAFVTGGIICCIGQFILNYAGSLGLDKQTAGSWCSLILVLLSVILTGIGVYPKIVKWGGAGALVPITGFANGVAAPAIEYKTEGQVFGIGCKIFTIAGPVILYGILASWLLGLGYWVLNLLGLI